MASMTAAAPRPHFNILKVARAIAGGAVGILFGLAIGAAVVAILATQFFGFHLVTISSNSMEPKLSVGDIAVVRPASQNDIKPNDVIMFTRGTDNIPTIHRVLGENKLNTVMRDSETGAETVTTSKRFVTKGDNNARPDTGDVLPSQVMGEVWFTVPAMGGATDFPLQTALIGFALLLGVGWVSYELYSRAARKEKAAKSSGELSA